MSIATTFPTAPPSQPQQRRAPENIAELLTSLGDVPASRVLLSPPPGTATEADVIRHVDGDAKRLVELVNGTLVEKAMGYWEGVLAGAIIESLRRWVRPRKLGVVSGADGMMRMKLGNVRLPDVSLVMRSRIPRGMKREQIMGVPPDLAVEVVSPSNTRRELAIKRQEYFASGTRLVGQIDPEVRTCDVYTRPDAPDRTLREDDTLDGGDVLPGFALSLRELFAELDDED